jgi:hypothetical protein
VRRLQLNALRFMRAEREKLEAGLLPPDSAAVGVERAPLVAAACRNQCLAEQHFPAGGPGKRGSAEQQIPTLRYDLILQRGVPVDRDVVDTPAPRAVVPQWLSELQAFSSDAALSEATRGVLKEAVQWDARAELEVISARQERTRLPGVQQAELAEARATGAAATPQWRPNPVDGFMPGLLLEHVRTNHSACMALSGLAGPVDGMLIAGSTPEAVLTIARCMGNAHYMRDTRVSVGADLMPASCTMLVRFVKSHDRWMGSCTSGRCNRCWCRCACSTSHWVCAEGCASERAKH